MNEPFYEINDNPTINNTNAMVVVSSNDTMEDNCTFCLEKCFGCSCFDLCGELNGTENYDNCTECYDGLWQKELEEEEATSEIPEVNILFNGLSDDEVEEEFGIVPLTEDGKMVRLEGHVQLISAPKCSILYEIKLHFLKSFLRGVTLGTFGTQYITPFFKSFLGRSDISDKWNITSFFQIFPGKE